MRGEFPVTTIISQLDRLELLPAILFRTSRRQCDLDIERLSKSKIGALSAQGRTRLLNEVESIIFQYKMQSEVVYGHAHYQALINTGTGAHHAGQLLMWRLVLEELMSRGLLRLMIATGTVAAGVDFPARTVIVTAHSRRSSSGFNVISSSEFQQMAGRAGRRGKDSVGICLVAPGPFSDARVVYQVSKRPAEPLTSAYFAAPATVLNLLKYRNVDDLTFTIQKSFAAFLDRKAAAKLDLEAEDESLALEQDQELRGEGRKKAEKRVRRKRNEAKQIAERQEAQLIKCLAALRELKYVDGGNLSEKGYWAANLCTSLVLELSEAIDQHLLTDLNEEELVAMLGSISGDPHRQYLRIKRNPIKKDLYERMKAIIDTVQRIYPTPVNSEVAVQPDAGLTVLSWLEAPDWQDFAGILRLGGVAEGDVARLVMQTADHLNQISKLEESHPDLARIAEAARRKLVRPPLTDALLSD